MNWENIALHFGRNWPFFLTSLLVLLAEAFFSGSEMALISADRLALKRLATQGHRGAQTALKLLSQPEKLLATVLIGTSFCILLQGTIFTIYIHDRLGEMYDAYTVAIITPLVLIFGELLPKTIFQRFSRQISPRVAQPIFVIQLILNPVIKVIHIYTQWLSKKTQPFEELLTGKNRITQREVLTYLLTHGRKETSIKRFQNEMIHRILNFSRSTAKNASIPLVKVDALDADATVAEALAFFAVNRHSRIPVYDDRVDYIIGILFIFDLFHVEPENHTRPIRDFVQKPFFAPESQKLDELMFTMQASQNQMAVVVDEYGGAVGIVTLEDLIEEIVGEIKDEYDEDQDNIQQQGDHRYLVTGSTSITRLNEKLHLNLPTGEYETLAGFLLLQFNRIPGEGDELYYKDVKFLIYRATEQAIRSVEISIIDSDGK